MSKSYSGDPSSSDMDMYRFLIGDTGLLVGDTTNTDIYVLNNEEIQFVLNSYAEHNARMYYLYNCLSNSYAKVYKRALGPQVEDPTSMIKYFSEKSVEYKKLLGAASGLSLPVYGTDKVFRKGMHDNV